jgi:hypothetical protein
MRQGDFVVLKTRKLSKATKIRLKEPKNQLEEAPTNYRLNHLKLNVTSIG